MTNTGLCGDTYNFTCSVTGTVSCSNVSPVSQALGTGQNVVVMVTYTLGTPGTGVLKLTALGEAGGAQDIGTFNLTAVDSRMVRPDGAVDVTRRANTGGDTAVFTVWNTGKAQDTYTLACTGSANVTCGTVSPSSVVLPAGASASVTVAYSAGAAGTGTLSLTATGTIASDGGSYTVPVAAAGGPLVDFGPYNHAKQDYGSCAVACFATIYAQSTAPYFSLDAARNVTLVYNSDRVNPRPFVHVNVTPDTGYTPAEYRLEAKVNGVFVNFVNGDQTLRFTYPGRVKARLGGQFDASGYATGVYPLEIIVSAYYPGTGLITTALTTKLVVVNQTSAAVAAGWAVGGVQRVYVQSDSSVLVTEGDGGAVHFAKLGALWVSPSGEFSTFGLSGVAAPTWVRRYPDGSRAAFDNVGRMVSLKDRFNNATAVVYDGSSRVWKITDPANLTITLAYNANGLATVQDPGTPVRTTSVVVDGSHKLTSITDPDNVSTAFVFNADLQLQKIVNRRGDTTQLTYDGLSRKLTAITHPPVSIYGSGTVSPLESHAPWQHVGVPYTTTVTTAAAAPLADTVRARLTDPRGYTTVLQVDRFGAPTRVDDALGRSTSFTRDRESRGIRDSLPSGQVVRRSWSGPSVIQVWDSTTGRTVNYTYETTWSQLTQMDGDVDSLWNYWSSGHLDSIVAGARPVSNPLRRLTTFTYDALGRPLSASDARAHPATFYYSPTSWRNTDSTKADTRRTAYTYDAYGRLATFKTPQNKVTTIQYDALSRRTRVVGPIADTTVFTYDSLFLRQVRDAMGQTYQFAHNALGWVVSRTDPVGKQDQYQYDQNGNVRQWTNRRNQVITWDLYDGLNRATLMTDAGGMKTKAVFDSQERFGVDSNAASIDTIRFDPAGRPTAQISVRAGTRYELRDTFNIRNLRTMLRIVSPWTDTIAYHYSESMLLDTLTDLAGGQTAVTYNSDLQPSGATLPTGLVITRGYPSTHKPQQITFSNPSINSAIGAYYFHNNLGKIEDRGDPSGIGGRDFGYDALERLSSCGDYTWQASGCDWYCDPHTGCRWQCLSQQKVYSQTRTFSYDSLGNRHDLGAAITTGNRLVKFNGDSLVYDDDGNFIKRIRAGQDIQRLWWNSLGQLIAVWTAGQDSVTFAYDGLGRRVTKQKASGTTRYVYDRFELFAEVDSATGNRLVEYTYYPGIDRPHSERVGGPTGPVYYYAQDFPGNVIGLINSSNTLVNNYKYEPFGADGAGSSATVGNSLKFAARQYDSETGLYYVRARYYDPQVGRFISEDPIGLAGGINAYSYTRNDPVNQIDPSGLCAGPWIVVCVGAGIGAIAGAYFAADRYFERAGNNWTTLGLGSAVLGGAIIGGVLGAGATVIGGVLVESGQIKAAVAVGVAFAIVGDKMVDAWVDLVVAAERELGRTGHVRGYSGGTIPTLLAGGWSRFYPSGWGQGLWGALPGITVYNLGGGAFVVVGVPDVGCHPDEPPDDDTHPQCPDTRP
ncbi:MAG TPA: RHS repeat-associated core domain-containing protein [Gemmatimonadales bacterium]|nr:RHS repeat-associated core domain-containing protein [Gemmatimonadales bacterium]